MSFQTTRRDFIKKSTIAGAGFLCVAGSTAKVARASARSLAIAGIGVGGKGSATSNKPVFTAKSSRCAISTATRSKVKRRTSPKRIRSSTRTIANSTLK